MKFGCKLEGCKRGTHWNVKLKNQQQDQRKPRKKTQSSLPVPGPSQYRVSSVQRYGIRNYLPFNCKHILLTNKTQLVLNEAKTAVLCGNQREQLNIFSLLLHRASCRFNNYHTTNKCTNCMSFIFKSLF